MRENSSPAVSFVVPSFNETPEILRHALQSVAEQTFADFECLVIDDSTKKESIDACVDFCTRDGRFRRIAPETRLGLAPSLNVGVAQARGDLIARFDSDDICLPDRLARQVEMMRQSPEIGVVGGGLEIIDADGRTLAFREYPQDHETIARKLQFTTPLAHPTIMMRKQVIVAAGGYDPSFRYAEDLDLWLRLQNAGVRFGNLPQTLVKYRQASTSRNPAHWKFNSLARRKNFTRTYLLRRMAGIVAISGWSYFPSAVQEKVFGALVLNRPGG